MRVELNPIRGAYNQLEVILSEEYLESEGQPLRSIKARISQRNHDYICAKLQEDSKRRKVSGEAFYKASRRIFNFVEEMNMDMLADEESISFDSFMEDSITVKFKKRSDVKLNISLNDVEDPSDESFLAYSAEGEDCLVNDSLHNIVLILKDILKP